MTFVHFNIEDWSISNVVYSIHQSKIIHKISHIYTNIYTETHIHIHILLYKSGILLLLLTFFVAIQKSDT